MSRSDLSVVVCAYTEDRWDDLVGAVASLRRQTKPPCEIIIVIDHNPRLLERVRSHLDDRFAGARVVANREAMGLSGARNSGVAAARGTLIGFLDDDAVAEPDWSERLLAAYADSRVLGAGGAIAPWWLAGRPAWFPEEFAWVVGCTYRGLPRQVVPVRNLIGANMSFRREVFERVGGFRDGVGQVGASMLRCDDTEFCLRVRRQLPDGVLLYEPRAGVRHRVPPARARWHYFRVRCFTEGQAKALVVRLAGARDGLASERAYTVRTLPGGVMRGLADAVWRRDPAGLARAGAIVAGLALTTAGYMTGIVAERFARLREVKGDIVRGTPAR